MEGNGVVIGGKTKIVSGLVERKWRDGGKLECWRDEREERRDWLIDSVERENGKEKEKRRKERMNE